MSKPKGPSLLERLAEHPETAEPAFERRLKQQSRRDFLLFGLGAALAAAGGWWLLPDRTRARVLPWAHNRLDTLAARVGLSGANRERILTGALSFDDDVAEALYSKDREVRTYARSETTPLKPNYHGQAPLPEALANWSLELSGLASGRTERLTLASLAALGLRQREQVTRLICVEGWSAVVHWGGYAFADVLKAFPPAEGARWAALRSDVSRDTRGRPEPYFVSLDLATARHPQTLLATHLGGSPLALAHGAPVRLVAPMKLGLKNIKAITQIAFQAEEPGDYWNLRGYSKYDGL
jgi:DMSO/TMAO reductase YedYZ molybdopterin-dependent catalytic subunit